MLCNAELEGLATEADRVRAREIIDELYRLRALNRNYSHSRTGDFSAPTRSDLEFVVIRGLVAHRLAAEGGARC